MSRSEQRRNGFMWVAAFALALFLMVSTASAQTSSSNNYQVTESFFGTGGELDASSGSYQAKQSAGELTVGAMRSAIYSAQAGFNTDRVAYIAIAALDTTVDVGVLNPGNANVGTAQFWVRGYLVDGYVVGSYGGPPKNGSYAMQTSATPFTSSSGTEQFGFNLAVNTITGAQSMVAGTQQLRENFGADATQAPDYTADPFGFGVVDPEYATPNNFKYENGDAIASSTRSSSDTTYTISYLFNISPVTPAGTYTMSHTLVATAPY